MRGLVAFLGLFLALPALAGTDLFDVPSGNPVSLQEVITEPNDDGDIFRFRFVTPHLAEQDVLEDIEKIELDMNALCETVALPYIRENGAADDVGRVVISFAERPTEFGVANPDVVQTFESYTVAGNACVWEAF